MEDNTDIKFLLSILHGITITDEFAEKVIEAWRMYHPTILLSSQESLTICLIAVELCVPPVDGEELRRRREEIWHKVSLHHSWRVSSFLFDGLLC
jgi:hypothetical protein